MNERLEDLINLLDIERIEVNLFRGQSPSDRWQRVFGGQVIGQALVAARVEQLRIGYAILYTLTFLEQVILRYQFYMKLIDQETEGLLPQEGLLQCKMAKKYLICQRLFRLRKMG